MGWRREALLRDLENAKRLRDYWQRRYADLERQWRASMASEWREWDGLLGSVSRVEMEASKMWPDYSRMDTPSSSWPAPPTSTCPSTPDANEPTPGESGGDATGQQIGRAHV